MWKRKRLILINRRINVPGVHEERRHNSPFQVAQETLRFAAARLHAVQSDGRLLAEVSPSRLHSQRKAHALPLPSGSLRYYANSSIWRYYHYCIIVVFRSFDDNLKALCFTAVFFSRQSHNHPARSAVPGQKFFFLVFHWFPLTFVVVLKTLKKRVLLLYEGRSKSS